MEYLCVTTLASLLIYGANHFRVQEKKATAWCLVILSILVFSFVAGGRDVSVGKDVLVYGRESYNLANAYGFDYYTTIPIIKNFGLLSQVTCWAIARVSPDLSVYLFLLEVVMTAPVVIACSFGFRKYAWAGVAVFGMVFFPASLNMMKQFMAMGFVLAAYFPARDKQIVRYGILMLVACLYHTSALVALPVYPIVRFIQGGGFTRIAVGCALAVIAFLLFPEALSILGFMAGGYSTYLEGIYAAASGGTQPNIVLTACLIAGVILYLAMEPTPDAINRVIGLFSLVFLGVLGCWLSEYSFYLYRVGFYYLFFLVLIVPSCLQTINGAGSRRLFTLGSLSLCCIFAFDYYIIIGSHDVFPYVFNWMGK